MNIALKLFGPKAAIAAVALGLTAGGVLSFGDVAAVAITQTAKTLMGARATTSASTVVTATHNGVNIASTGDAGAAAGSITAHATIAATPFRANTLAAGDYYYSVRFASTAADDDIPSGMLRLRWTVAGTQNTANLSVTGIVVDTGATGGWTVLIPGSASDTPENIQAVFEQA